MISDDLSVLLCLPIIIGYREIMLQVGNFCQQRVLQLHKPVEMISASFIQSHSVTSSYTSSLADHSRYRDTLGHDSWANCSPCALLWNRSRRNFRFYLLFQLHNIPYRIHFHCTYGIDGVLLVVCIPVTHCGRICIYPLCIQ